MTNPKATALIQSYSDENLWKFFNDRNHSLTRSFERIPDLQHSPDYSEIRKLGEMEFSVSERLMVCSIAVAHSLNERSGKKAQYELAKQILKQHGFDSDGIFVFHDPEGNFRFSLIYSDFVGNKRKDSNYRRFTYYVSPQLTNKTFLQRVGDGDFSSLEKIKEAFSVEKVTKEFYQEISYWYFWACQQVRFPEAAEKEDNGRQVAVIRMITRLIFIWFMREKGLVPAQLFDLNTIKSWLKELGEQSSSYYLGILQNLFFATLNTETKNRQFRSEIRGLNGYNPDFGNHTKYRHQNLFTDPTQIDDYFRDIPFLNGGLFDCLDNPDQGDYFDGFSDIKKNQPAVPNKIFFASEQPADFNKELGTANQKYKVKGLMQILSTYNFTIDENTVDDKDVALDPELLGRVFENLLASFNPETSSTARKATGSYYTPREIVDYMVDETLKAYLQKQLTTVSDLEKKINWLFSKEKEGNPFTPDEVKHIVELVESVRIVDPAVGSGAFPMGALNRLVLMLDKLDPQGNLWEQAQLAPTVFIPDFQIREKVQSDIRKAFKEKNHDYSRKLFLIQKCIYGVDIQQIAVEIAKLRFFISLLVDETVNKDKDNWDIKPLPNLDFKLMQGNSLISLYEGIDLGPRGGYVVKQEGLFENLGEKGLLINEFKSKKELYQYASDHQAKQQLQKEIDQLLVRMFNLNTLDQRQDYASRLRAIDRKYQPVPDLKTRENLKAIEVDKVSKEMGINVSESGRALNQYSAKQMRRDFFPWGLYFAEVFAEKGGFDVVLGNPPYIGEKGHKELFEEVKRANLKQFYLGKMDYFYFFFHLALDLCRQAGHVAFISTNYYPTATGALKLRKDLHDRTTVYKLINFNELKIFETAMGQHNMITLLSKGKEVDIVAETSITERAGSASNEILVEIINGEDKNTKYFKVSQEEIFDGEDFQIRIQGVGSLVQSDLQTILNKMKSKGVQLGSLCNVNQGIVTGADKVSNRHVTKYKISSKIGTGIFVLNEREISNIKLFQSEKQVIKPWFKNSDVKRWATNNHTNENILYLDRSSSHHPNILNYLDPYKKVLLNRREVENGVIDWWQLQWPRSESIFLKEKIVAPQRSSRNTFGYNEIPWFASADVYYITQIDKNVNLKYILALLNSKIYYLWLYHRGKRKGETLELYQTPLSQVPIPKISDKYQTPFIQAIDEILRLAYSADYSSNKSKQEKVGEIERSINQLTYSIFDLSDAEIEFIERIRIN